MTDPLTGIHEPTVVIPWWLDCRESPLAISIAKTAKVFINAIPHMYDNPNDVDHLLIPEHAEKDGVEIRCDERTTRGR